MSHVYDYIVVGAGSAGCVVANRLSTDPKHRVLLLEAGGKDWNPWIHIPVGYYRTMYHPDISWGYETEPDAGVNNRVMIWPRGRVLGGSSSINGLLYVRGQHQDYDHWRQLGNEGWGWDDVLPFFKKSESYERGGSALRGGDGPLSVSDIADRRPVCEAFLKACEEVGIPQNEDYNGATQDGAGYYQTTSRNGRRCSAAVAYLNPIKSRKNLHVKTRALASKLELKDGRARGITYLRDGIEYRAEATREIVLCGGAINSPQLLQLSGIGPAEHLRSVGIPVQRDLPGVGDDLQDHFQVRAIYELDGLESLNTDVGNPLKRIAMGLQYVPQRSAYRQRRASLRLHQDSKGTGNTGYPVPLHSVQRGKAGPDAASLPRSHIVDLPAPPGKPRQYYGDVGQRTGLSKHQAELSFNRRRPANHYRRHETEPEDFPVSGLSQISEKRI